MRDITEMMVGYKLVTPPQDNDLLYPTTLNGFLCRCVYVIERLEPIKKFWLKIELDREKCCPVLKYCDLTPQVKFDNFGYGTEPEAVEGFKLMRISDIKKDEPHRIKVMEIDYLRNLRMDKLMNMALDLGIENQKS